MRRKVRRIQVGDAYHVINRGVDRRRLFFSDDDYRGFEALIQDVHDEVPLSIKTYELMPNHWHFAVVPTEDDQVSQFFQLLAGTHAKRLRSKSKTIGDGHIYQDRFRSFSVEEDEHFIALCRYIERNALRAGLVSRAENWPWGGLWKRLHSAPKWLDSGWCLPLPPIGLTGSICRSPQRNWPRYDNPFGPDVPGAGPNGPSNAPPPSAWPPHLAHGVGLDGRRSDRVISSRPRSAIVGG